MSDILQFVRENRGELRFILILIYLWGITVYCFVQFVKIIRLLIKGETASARIIKYERGYKMQKFPVMEFHAKKFGKVTAMSKTAVLFRSGKYAVGNSVKIHYDEKDPYKFTFDVGDAGMSLFVFLYMLILAVSLTALFVALT